MLFVVHFQQGKEERCCRKAGSSPRHERGCRSSAEPAPRVSGMPRPSWERRAKRERVQQQISPRDAQKPPYCRKCFYSHCTTWSHRETQLSLSPSITEGRNLPACERQLKSLHFRPVHWPELKPRPPRR